MDWETALVDAKDRMEHLKQILAALRPDSLDPRGRDELRGDGELEGAGGVGWASGRPGLQPIAACATRRPVVTCVRS